MKELNIFGFPVSVVRSADSLTLNKVEVNRLLDAIEFILGNRNYSMKLSRVQQQALLEFESLGYLEFDGERRGYNVGKQGTKKLVAYIVGAVFCDDYTTPDDKTWMKGRTLSDAEGIRLFFGFDVSHERNKGKELKSPKKWREVDDIMKKLKECSFSAAPK